MHNNNIPWYCILKIRPQTLRPDYAGYSLRFDKLRGTCRLFQFKMYFKRICLGSGMLMGNLAVRV